MSAEGALSWEQAVLWLKSQPDRADLIEACFFDDPLERAAARFYGGSEWKAVRSLWKPQRGRALDIGAGRGISALALAKDGWTTTALEPDPSNVVGAGAIRALSAATRTPIEVVETWGESLPFECGAFDLVFLRQVLHHARDLDLLCREINRVLKPGGQMIATREHVLSRREDLARFLAAHPLHHLYGGENAFLLSEYRGAIESSGMKLDRMLNPFESDINLYPGDRAGLKDAFARKLRLPSGRWVPSFLLTLRGRQIDDPGRLYSFVAHRPA
jgi:SAM-dependent methyltransferase